MDRQPSVDYISATVVEDEGPLSQLAYDDDPFGEVYEEEPFDEMDDDGFGDDDTGDDDNVTGSYARMDFTPLRPTAVEADRLSLPPVACERHTYVCGYWAFFCGALRKRGYKRKTKQQPVTVIQIRHTMFQNMVFAVNLSERVQCSQMVRSLVFMRGTVAPKNKLHHMMGDVDYMPMTYLMRQHEDAQELYIELCKKENAYQGGWITKPYSGTQGRGIRVFKDNTALRKNLFRGSNTDCGHVNQIFPGKIVQKYIRSPLLISGAKFHIRTYVLVADDDPLLVFQCYSKIMVGGVPYNESSTDIAIITSNTNTILKRTNFDVSQSQRTLSAFQNYLTEQNISNYTVKDDLVPDMYRILRDVFKRVYQLKSPPHPIINQFIILAADFLLDSDFKLWLMEINKGPGGKCRGAKSVCKMYRKMMKEVTAILEEIYERNLKGQSSYGDLESVKTFQYILDAS